MISPHPPRLRMKRRNTVSVTPAMGASTVAGVIWILPILTCSGTEAPARAKPPGAAFTGFSQYLRTLLFYCLPQIVRAGAQFVRLEIERRGKAGETAQVQGRPQAFQAPEGRFSTGLFGKWNKNHFVGAMA